MLNKGTKTTERTKFLFKSVFFVSHITKLFKNNLKKVLCSVKLIHLHRDKYRKNENKELSFFQKLCYIFRYFCYNKTLPCKNSSTKIERS